MTTDAAATAQRQQVRQQGFLAGLVTLPFRFLGVLLGSLLLCVVIECVGLHFFWPEEGWRHAQRMLNDEMAYISEDFTQSMVVQEPGRSAKLIAETAYRWIFVKTGLLDWISEAAARSRAGADQQVHDFRYFVGQVYVQIEAYLIASAYAVLVFAMRLLVLTLTLPLFVMAAFVGLVDGLVRRDVRSFGAGRESGFVYHRARAALMPLAVLPWVTYLALPISVHPTLILLPCAALLGIATCISAATFKKYL